ncbi:hypothetical protein [Streptomyces boninensis]|uniref:hypothetical protein n=1 Tax=Streptomyces boninensis TaxID=2039455 RepID=UPI003B20EA10
MSEIPVGQGPVHLVLRMGPKSIRPVPAAVAEALLSVQITATAGERSGFQIAFDLTKGGQINKRLLPERFFSPRTRVVATAVVRGTPIDLLDGIITRHEVGSSNIPGQSTLTITGEDLGIILDLEDRTAGYPNLSPAKRVRAILSQYPDYGITPDVKDEQIPQTALRDVRVDFQTGSDLQYVTELARANGYVFYLDPGPGPGRSRAYWGPQVRHGTPQHALNVNMDAHSTVDQLTFAYDGTAREDPQARLLDPVTRASELLPPEDISPLRPRLGDLPTPALRRKTLSGTAKYNREQARAELLARSATSADVISGSGSLDVTRHGYALSPRQLVGVRGAGKAYDGNYYVASVTHNLRPGSYQQNFTLSREGLNARGNTVRP